MSFYGREGLAGIDLHRRTACFHVNELAKLAGVPQVIPSEADFDYEEMRSVQSRYSAKRCFSQFDNTSGECESCEFRVECIERTAAYARDAG